MSEAKVEFDHGRRRGDQDNPHRGDCTGTLCPSCGCCQHCTHRSDCGCAAIDTCGCRVWFNLNPTPPTAEADTSAGGL